MQLKLFMVLLGCKPEAKQRSSFARWFLKKFFGIIESSRNTEQHDTTFAVGSEIKDCQSQLKSFWPNGNGLHVDAYVDVSQVGDYHVIVVPEDDFRQSQDDLQLFFVNLGGYEEKLFDEKHKKLLIVAKNMKEAIAVAKNDSFFQEGIRIGKGAPHIDDKAIIDDILCVSDYISGFRIVVSKRRGFTESISQVTILGFTKVAKLHQMQD